MANRFELIATNLEDTSIQATTTPRVTGRFPGVVCFYYSEKQRSQLYGTNEELTSPPFGFDPYIPKLYGETVFVRNSYIINNNIVSGYRATVGRRNRDVDVCIYPHPLERVKDSAEVLDASKVREGQERKYFCPWLYPSRNKMKLFISVLFPPAGKIATDDEFIQFKDTADEDNDVEKIYFKLVKVDTNWQPIETENGYVGIEDQTPVTEQQQMKQDQVRALEEESYYIEGQIKDAEKEIDKFTKEKEKLKEKQTERTTIFSEYNDRKNEFEKKSTQTNADKVNKKVEELKKIDQQIAGLQDSIKKNAPLLKEQEGIHASLKMKLSKLEDEIVRLKEEIREDNRLREGDLTLSLDSDEPFDFTFRRYQESYGYHTIQIQRDGMNGQAALIAYYKRIDQHNKERHHLVGQVNILPYYPYKMVETYPDIDSAVFDIHFNPMPMQFVKVDIQEGARISNWNMPDADTIVKNVNRYFEQAGISFYSINDPFTLTLPIRRYESSGPHRAGLRNRKALTVENKAFLVNGEYLKETEYTDAGDTGDLKTQLDLAVKNYLLTNVLYENGKISIKYKNFLKTFPDLCPDLKNEKQVRDRAEGIADYLVTNTCFVYMINHFKGADSQGLTHSAAYAMLRRNGVVMFKDGIEKWDTVLPHELGHTFGLQHTFHNSHTMYPNKVSFCTDSTWRRKTAFATGADDCKAYAATYNNIMDYESLPTDPEGEQNSDFKRTTFTKWQWEEIWKNIKEKSYMVSTWKGYTQELQSSYTESENIEIKNKFIEELTNLLR